MKVILSKTDYILFRECAKNAWYKIHRPDLWKEVELSDFEKTIIETGNEVELVARQLFPRGVLIKGRGAIAQEATQKCLASKEKILFQPVFLRDGFLAAVDVLGCNENDTYTIYEIKSTTDIDKKIHYHDLAFQIILLEKCGLKIGKANIIHLNPEYVKEGEININKFFTIAEVTEVVNDIKEEIGLEMHKALEYLSQDAEPVGYCICVYKGRSNHCATFAYSNPKVPAYGVHDISRIGANKTKLQELIDAGIFGMADISEEVLKKLSLPQQNQIFAYVKDKILIEKHKIDEELSNLAFPLYFLDYETFPAAIPRFDGFSPYQQIPFQYALHTVASPEAQPVHQEFLFSEATDPSPEFLKSLQKHIGKKGNVIVWNKKFERKINEELAKRNPNFATFIKQLNARVYDLMDIFGNQYYVHKDFKGKISIKNVLPILAPELSYKTLGIQEGGTASQKWNEAVNGSIAEAEKKAIFTDLKAYCKLDSLAMHNIWKHLTHLEN